MILERVDIPSFLRNYPPFDELDEERLADVVGHSHIEFFPEGTVIQQQSSEPSRYLYIVRTGAVEALDGDTVADVLREGELFGFVSLITGLVPAFTIRALEDTICYLVEGDKARELLGTRRGLTFLAGSLRRREISALDGSRAPTADPLQAPASSLLRRPPLVVERSASVGDVAEMMSRERVSCVLVRQADELGIVTDHDLRSRVLAAGHGPNTPVGDVVTSPVVTVRTGAPLGEIAAMMLERGIHHVPVEDDAGRLAGVVTHVDLIGVELRTPFAFKADLERVSTVPELIAEARRLPTVVQMLVEARGDPLDVTHVIGIASDTLTRRLLELHIDELGEPPCPWVWISLGSQGRHEQGLASDQDNALAYETSDADRAHVDGYFARLSALVVEGLEAAGFRRCRAGVTASNPEWRGTVADWADRFRSWIDDPGRLGIAFIGIAVDYRPVTGPLEIRPQLDDVMRDAASEAGFVRRLGTLAIDRRPPTGLMKAVVEDRRAGHPEGIDLKQGGVTPITNLARAWTVEAGLTENRTIRRLLDVADTGRVAPDLIHGLDESFRFLWQIRLESQVEHVKAGAPADDVVHAESLGPLTRQGLRDAFQMIDRAQDVMATQFGLRR